MSIPEGQAGLPLPLFLGSSSHAALTSLVNRESPGPWGSVALEAPGSLVSLIKPREEGAVLVCPRLEEGGSRDEGLSVLKARQSWVR